MVVRCRKRTDFPLIIDVKRQQLHLVNEFLYLGFLLKDRLNLKVSSAAQLQEAKLSFIICLHRLMNLPLSCPWKVAEHIFQAVVVNLADVNCEITGQNADFDALCLSFSKRIFQLEGSTPNDAVYLTTGYYPHTTRQTKKQLDFLTRAPKDSKLPATLCRAFCD